MPSLFTHAPTLQLNELALYHEDIVAALRLYFSPSAPTFAARFAGKRLDEVRRELGFRINESDFRSAFVVLTSLEATFWVDFDFRCRKRLKDSLSTYFRQIEKKRKRVRLDEDILEGWKRHTSAPSRLISDLRGAFKLRHWLAHGRYWTPNHDQKYNFAYVHLMADSIVSGFPFEG
jgi:hypothetical protein